jgi:hypothetical protein
MPPCHQCARVLRGGDDAGKRRTIAGGLKFWIIYGRFEHLEAEIRWSLPVCLFVTAVAAPCDAPVHTASTGMIYTSNFINECMNELLIGSIMNELI